MKSFDAHLLKDGSVTVVLPNITLFLNRENIDRMRGRYEKGGGVEDLIQDSFSTCMLFDT